MQLKFTTRIAVVATLLVTVFVTTSGMISFRAMRDMASTHMDEMLAHAGMMMTDNLDGTLEEINDNLRTLAANTLIGNALVDDLGRRIYLPNFLSGFTKVDGIPVTVLVTNFTGIPFATNRANAHLIPDPTVVAESIDINRPLSMVVDRDDDPTVVMVEPVVFANTGLPEGALVYQFTLADLLASPDVSRMSASITSVKDAGLVFGDFEGGGRHVIPSDLNRETSAATGMPFPAGSLAARLGLSLVLVADRSELDRTLGTLTVTYSGLGVIALVLVLISSLLASRQLTRRLRQLEESASAIVAEGRASGRFKVSGNDEVSSLGSAFNAVLERLDEAYAELEGRAREELGRQERKYRRVVEQAGEALFAFDHDGRILEANLFAGEMLGYPVDDLLALTVTDVAPTLEGETFAKEHAERPPGEAITLETEFRHRNGRPLPVEIRSGVIDLGGESQVLWMARDITERVEVMKKLEASNAELQQFAYVASHDLREPLRMVTSYLQLLDRRYRDALDTDAHEFIDYAVSGAKRMDALIKDLLQYARVESMGTAFAPADAEELLGEALDNLQEALAESEGIVTHDALPQILCDRHQIIRLFQNLIENALKYRDADRAPEIHVSSVTGPTGTTFSVRDNGIGIAPEHLERIFIIFQRLHGRDEYSGTGIGLAVCRKIVDRHGGRIWADGTPGEGSTFSFTLPAVD